MTETDTAEAPSAARSGEHSTHRRSPRTIRFSSPEWEKVERAAREINIPPATFARNAALAAAADQAAARAGSLPPGIVELIKRIYLGTYLTSTLKRDEMIREGRREELDRVVEAAREIRAGLLPDAPA